MRSQKQFAGCLFALLAVIGAGADGIAAEPVRPADVAAPAKPVTFEFDVQPLLTRFGCNAGACHGKSRGQNGFALSLLGFDADFDYDALIHEGRGRRIFPSTPEYSLLLRKPSGQMPHGGGKRFDIDSPQYRLLYAWIKAGAPRTPADAPKLLCVVVEPGNRSLVRQESLQLRVLAEYSDGTRRDVTDGSAFQSNDGTLAGVDANGLVKAGELPGEAAIMARYMNNIAVCAVTIPVPGAVPAEAYRTLPRHNHIDELVWQKLKLLGILPSAPAGDATFHRRAYLRAIGRLPTPEETRAFLADHRPDKRVRLIDQLLERPEYADFWANKWADLLRPNPYRAGIKAVWNLDSWLRAAFRKNMPYDQFVRELITAQGSTWHNGAAVIFRDRPEPVELGASISQLFLGTRLECAKCHHHPFEVWGQDDFFGFAAFFARVGHKGQGLSPPISGGEEMIYTTETGQLKHGRTGATVTPKLLAGAPLTLGPNDDPREALAEWMTSPDNPFFAKVMANRIWKDVMGQGLVEPVDDLRATNPPSNGPLLDALAEDFRKQGYDIKKLIREIMASYVFSLSTEPNPRNVADLKNFSRYYRDRMRAEVLLDAVNDVLGTEETFAAMPPGSRATQLWTHRSPSLFLDTFSRPDPNLDPPCERSSDCTTPQVLHLMNSPALSRKLSLETARPAKLAANKDSNEKIVEEIYLLAYCRYPTDVEKKTAVAVLTASGNRRRAVEDLFWAILNTPEFLFID
ncbi:MAG TPA: DUF1549 domain-containing protein [Gemmataceae bacterium]|nr:DUF1549 domain-containing protein [Gemmataceae bacterium]